MIAELTRRREAGHPGFVYLVLTVDPRKYGSPTECERHLCGKFTVFVKRLRRACGPSEYAVFVEWTRKAWPHLNVLLINDRLWRLCAESALGPGRYRDYHMWLKGPGWLTFERYWLRAAADQCGLGRIVYARPIRCDEALARYAVKEAGKTYQIRRDYLHGFRRCRYSQGFFTKRDDRPSGVQTIGLAIHAAPIEAVLAARECQGYRPTDPAYNEAGKLEEAYLATTSRSYEEELLAEALGRAPDPWPTRWIIKTPLLGSEPVTARSPP